LSYLLDTNIVSEMRKPNRHPNVHAWATSVTSADLHISVLVLGEIRRGIETLRSRDPAQAAAIERWLAGLPREYGDRIIPITGRVAEHWGRLNVPRTVAPIDGLMAATAIVMGLTFVTRNTADVERTGVMLLNPFL
jgi:toxin FitB